MNKRRVSNSLLGLPSTLTLKVSIELPEIQYFYLHDVGGEHLSQIGISNEMKHVDAFENMQSRMT